MALARLLPCKKKIQQTLRQQDQCNVKGVGRSESWGKALVFAKTIICFSCEIYPSFLTPPS
jgi:hypothetical protein